MEIGEGRLEKGGNQKADIRGGGRRPVLPVAVLGFVLAWSSGCAQPPTPESRAAPAYGYDFSSPDTVFKLDKKLDEISGLTVFDEGHLAAVHDEHGRFYVIDFQTGELTGVYRFAGKDDYEGIAMAGNRLFALRSDGQLREILDYDSDKPDSDRVKTPLHKKCDAEGLVFDAANNRLLIACKEHPGKGLKRQRAIYALDLESMDLSPQPVYTIPTDKIDLSEGSLDDTIRDFVSPLVDLDGFKPSALAIHPVTGELFVLSSVLKVIVVVAHDGNIQAILRLDDDLLEQPEGMAFLPSGDLFIASEGVRKKARLVRFNYRPNQ